MPSKFKMRVNDWLGGLTLHPCAPFWFVKLILNIQIKFFDDCIRGRQ